MFASKKFSQIATMAVSAAVLTFAAMEANASHFRYGTYNWSRTQANPLQVTFSITEAWRASDTNPATQTAAVGNDVLYFQNFGDGNADNRANAQATRSFVGNFADANGERYVVFNRTVTHTYPAAGTFNTVFGSCCRIGTLQNGNANAAYNVNGTVDLTSGASNFSSPVAQAPIIVPMPITTAGNTTSFQLPFIAPEGEDVTVSVATTAQSGLNSTTPTAPGGNNAAMTVSSTGLLEWDTSGTTAGQKFAIQLRVDEDDNANSIPVDFIIEIGNAQANQAPTVDGATFNLEVGDVLSHTVTGNDPDNGPSSPLTWTLNSITGPEALDISDYSFDTNTQLLTWDTAGYATGSYTFFISNFDGAANGLGQIIVNVSEATVSEPGMALVFGLGLAGIAYTRRRKLA